MSESQVCPVCFTELSSIQNLNPFLRPKNGLTACPFLPGWVEMDTQSPSWELKNESMAKIHMLAKSSWHRECRLQRVTVYQQDTTCWQGCSDPATGVLRLLWLLTGDYLNPGQLCRQRWQHRMCHHNSTLLLRRHWTRSTWPSEKARYWNCSLLS